MTNIDESVASYFEGCVGVGVFDCFVHPPSLHPNPNHPQNLHPNPNQPPTEAIGKGTAQPPHVSKLVGTGDVSK